MKKKILLAMPIEARHTEIFKRLVEGTDFELVDKNNQELRAEDVADVDAIIGSVPPQILIHAEKLKWLQLIFAGADMYTPAGVLRENVLLTNASGAYDTAVSEHMLALTFGLVRRFGECVRNQEKHIWKKTRDFISISGSTILILGAGKIGGSYAQKVKALGAYVIGVRRTAQAKPDHLDEQHTIENLDSVIGRADIIAMVLPGGEKTRHIIDAKRIAKMKDGAYLINVGRGNAIEPEALKAALRSGKLGGAGLDVTESEPLPAADELWNFENVIITPHNAWQIHFGEILDEIVKICSENLGHWIKGEPLKNIVNRAVGY